MDREDGMGNVFSCETCRLALTNPQWAHMCDMKCRDCRNRHLDHMLEVAAASVGLEGIPVEQVKDEYFEHLLEGREGERPPSV